MLYIETKDSWVKLRPVLQSTQFLLASSRVIIISLQMSTLQMNTKTKITSIIHLTDLTDFVTGMPPQLVIIRVIRSHTAISLIWCLRHILC